MSRRKMRKWQKKIKVTFGWLENRKNGLARGLGVGRTLLVAAKPLTRADSRVIL
jgi:hypothetical protein